MKLKLEENCVFINGGSWKAREYSLSGYPVLKVSNFNKDSISYNELSYLQESSFEKYKKNQLRHYDVVIATVGSHPSLINSAAGRSLVIPKAAEGLLLNQNAVCLRTKNKDVIDQKYLGYLCKSQLFEHYIQQRGKGAANQMRIPIGGIKSFQFNFPKIQIQRKTASILSAYDDLIENNVKRIKLLEEKAQYRFELLFQNERKDWRSLNLGEIVGFDIGGGWGKEFKEEGFQDPAYVIRGTDIDDLPSGKIENVPLRWHKKSNLKSRKLKHGDIVFEVSGGSSTAGVAKSLLITESLLVQFDQPVMSASFCKLMRPEKVEYVHLLYLFIQYLRRNRITEIFEKRSASNIVNYNWTAFLEYQKIKLPDLATLEKFNDEVEAIYKLIYNTGKQNQLLKEARNILLPRLMTGMIDVEKLELEEIKEQPLGMVAEDQTDYKKN